jgi:GNAT superfamily N-acetyltransferase
VVERSIEHSFPFGVYRGDEQAGFARVVTDRATFAWLADVYIEPAHRGRGLGKRLVGAVLAHPELAGMRRWMLGTADAHGLYRRFGFVEIEDSGRFMVVEGEAAARLCSGD